MAAVLEALASYVKQKVKDMAQEEVRTLMFVSGEIDKLGDNVGKLESYLSEAERRRIDQPSVQECVSKLKGALYEATDILELCQLDADERRRNDDPGCCWTWMEENWAPGWVQPLLFFLRNPAFAHSMGCRIKQLNEELDKIRKEMVEFRFEPLGSFPVMTAPSDATPHSRTTTSLVDESAVVGDAIMADTNALVQVLLSDEPRIMAVSIVGAGGIGKSTLAKKIFNAKNIQDKFQSKIWLSVTEIYNKEKLLGTAITQAGGGSDPGGDQQVLTQSLAAILSTSRFLVVMDDVWSDAPWAQVLQSPLVNAARQQPGSRVIITTRNEELVRHMGATYHQHHVKPMDDFDAWSLLKMQLLPQDVGSESALDQLKHIGMGIIKKCDGLPLAIKAIGGLLRTKRANENEWKGVLNNPTWSTDKTHSDLNYALRLSYEDLSPPQLKQCFLYYSLLPKGLRIPDEFVIAMWMSEGFLQVPAGNEGNTEEGIGLSYCRDLITRNLIEPTSLDGGFFRMHGVIRSFAHYMAKEEALVINPAAISPLISSKKFRRLSIESTELGSGSMVLPEWSRISGKQELLRSLIIIGGIKFDSVTDSSLGQFPSLRALFLKQAESDRFVESLCKLKHLRFLHLESTDVSRLPDGIDKMKFLQHIVLWNCPNFAGQLPSSILKLKRLRYLCVVNTKFIVPKGFSGLIDLRSLPRFPVQMDGEWCSLQELGPLSQLRHLGLENIRALPSSSLAAEAKIFDKEHLTTLTLSFYKENEVIDTVEMLRDCQRMEEVFDQLCPPPHLENLVINAYTGQRPPSWMCMTARALSVDSNSLTSLTIQTLPLCNRLPDGLKLLPSLEHLTIDVALSIRRVGPEFQQIDNNSLCFPRLQNLRFKMLPEWEDWDWEEEIQAKAIAMPALQTLFINRCMLCRLPAGLSSSRRVALTTLALEDVPRITAVENFPSVLKLVVSKCPSLRVIRGITRVQFVGIQFCPSVEVLECGPALDRLELSDPGMETLPGYLRGLKPRILIVHCNRKLRDLLYMASNSDSADYQAELEKIPECENCFVRAH